jgi:hypothetical protein
MPKLNSFTLHAFQMIADCLFKGKCNATDTIRKKGRGKVYCFFFLTFATNIAATNGITIATSSMIEMSDSRLLVNPIIIGAAKPPTGGGGGGAGAAANHAFLTGISTKICMHAR